MLRYVQKKSRISFDTTFQQQIIIP